MFSFFYDITFAYPQLLWLLLLLPVFITYEIFKAKRKRASMLLSTFNGINIKPTISDSILRLTPKAFRYIALAALVFALARPQSRSSYKNVKTEGIDIILSLDISASMLAKDFKPNRLEASKEVAIRFIDERPNDRIGLVIFSGESFTQCPLTTDHAVIKNLFSSIRTGMISDGTAIGMGLANAVNRIKDSKAKSKVVILLTDGVNNAGSIAPETSAEIAKAFGVRVYTIGVGTMGKALSPVSIYPNGQFEFDYRDVKIDEEVLTHIAEMTGGKYYRATDKTELQNIYASIDKLEKTVIEEKSFTNRDERYLSFALIALSSVVMEVIIGNTLIRTLP